MLFYVLIFLLAAAVRFGYLAYNLSWHLPDFWQDVARMSLEAARAKLGLPSIYSDISPNIALDLFKSDDRGLMFLHDLFFRVFGNSSLLHVQVLNILIDSSMVFAMIYLGKVLKDRRFGIICGFAYALFLPQIFISINPSWYTALNAGAILLLCHAVYLYKNPQFTWARLIKHTFVVVLLTFVVAQFRSTIILYPAFLCVLVAIFFRFKQKILSSSMMLGGLSALLLSAFVNQHYTGIFIPTRSNTGHCFWIGVGEFPNSYGVTESDASIGDFYRRNTGIEVSWSDMASFKQYESWLKARAMEFLVEQPGVYASMVVRRAGKVLFPNFRIQRVADEEAYARVAEKNREQRLAITKSGRVFTAQGIIDLWKIDPIFFFELAIRSAFFLLLPIGAALGAWHKRRDPMLVIYASGLLYSLATIAPLRGPANNHFSAWSTTLPLVILGLAAAISYLKESFVARRNIFQ